MSNTRSTLPCTAAAVLTLGLFVATSAAPPAAGAQPSPLNMRSGVATGLGPAGVPAFTVPADQYFVLTDFDWNPAIAASGDFVTTVTVYSGMTPRWSRPAVTQGVPGSQCCLLFYPSFHNTTGIVFTPGSTVFVAPNNTIPPPLAWTASWSGYLVSTTQTAVLPAEDGARAMALRPVPNPAADDARFELTVPADGPGVLAVFAVDGRRVRTLHDGPLAAGNHVFRWDGRDDAGAEVPRGVYFAQLQTENGTGTARVTLLH